MYRTDAFDAFEAFSCQDLGAQLTFLRKFLREASFGITILEFWLTFWCLEGVSFRVAVLACRRLTPHKDEKTRYNLCTVDNRAQRCCCCNYSSSSVDVKYTELLW